MSKSDKHPDEAGTDQSGLIDGAQSRAATGDSTAAGGEAIDDLEAKKAANLAAQREAAKEAAKEAKAAARRAAATEREDKRAAQAIDSPSPGWWVPTLCTLMVLGLFWLVVYYLTAEKYPVPGIGLGNMAIGFVLILVGFGMTTRWR